MWSILYFLCVLFILFFFKQKTAYEMRISDWSSDVCSSDLPFRDRCAPSPFHSAHYIRDPADNRRRTRSNYTAACRGPSPAPWRAAAWVAPRGRSPQSPAARGFAGGVRGRCRIEWSTRTRRVWRGGAEGRKSGVSGRGVDARGGVG